MTKRIIAILLVLVLAFSLVGCGSKSEKAAENNKKGEAILAEQKPNVKRALSLFESAAKAGNVEAMFNAGLIYASGRNGHCDLKKAREYYQQAADLGSASALYILGNYAQYGIGVEADSTMAETYFRRAMEQFESNGCQTARDWCIFGTMTANGLVGAWASDYDALLAYQTAASMEDSEGYYYLGTMHMFGNAYRDEEQGLAYLKTAADMGSASACSVLIMLNTRFGSSVDYDLALKYCQILIDKGYPAGYIELGRIQLDENYDGYNVSKGLKNIQKAAGMNSSDAYCLLGEIYYDGIGVECNEKKGLDYYQTAADLGSYVARERLKQLN